MPISRQTTNGYDKSALEGLKRDLQEIQAGKMKNFMPDRIDIKYGFETSNGLLRGATWVYHVSLLTDRPGYAARMADRFGLGRNYVEYAAVRAVIKQLDMGKDHHARVVAHVHGITRAQISTHFPERQDAIDFVGEEGRNAKELGTLAEFLRPSEA